jgi:phage tail-like protein
MVRLGFTIGVLAVAATLALTVTLVVRQPVAEAAPVAQRPGPSGQGDPISPTRYSLTIDGVEIAAFNQLTGITAEVDISEYFETSERGVAVNKLPGKLKPPTITLQRGLTSSMELWAWHEAVRSGQMAAARKSASLTMFNAEGKPVAKYWLENAWPSKLEVGALKAGSSDALMETVTLTAENIQRVAP